MGVVSSKDVEASGEPQEVSIVRSLPNQTLIEQKTQANAVSGVVTFSANIQGIGIYNTDAANAGVFIVNGIAINVPADKYCEFVVSGTPSNVVTISGSNTYIISRLV